MSSVLQINALVASPVVASCYLSCSAGDGGTQNKCDPRQIKSTLQCVIGHIYKVQKELGIRETSSGSVSTFMP